MSLPTFLERKTGTEKLWSAMLYFKKYTLVKINFDIESLYIKMKNKIIGKPRLPVQITIELLLDW